jgi:hypothetical protein
MISDPKMMPDSPLGRILFAVLINVGTVYVQIGLYRTNGLLWSLTRCSVLTPLIDFLLPGTKYRRDCLITSEVPYGATREDTRL